MPNPAASLARSVSEGYRNLVAFEASETVHAGPIEAAARVRFRRPERLVVEYSTYRNPIALADELLGGGVEFAEDDLTSMTLTFDGVHTWHVSARSDFLLKRVGRTLYEPLPGYDTLAELGFLADLAHDFLIRDDGTTDELGRPARVLGLKPKRARRSCLLKSISYPFERAIVDVDAESLFPLRIRFRPSGSSPLVSLLGPEEWVTIRYTNVRLGTPDEAAFVPSAAEDSRVFVESFVSPPRLAEALPVHVSLDALSSRGFAPLVPCAVVTDGEGKRGYATVWFARRAGEATTNDALLTLRIGNYLSRHMARRRATIAERGEDVALAAHSARYLDRSVLWGDEHAAPPPAPFVVDLSWDDAGVFTILTADGLAKPELMELASKLEESR
ncbi:MAG: hypothetical protein PHV11_05315 [Candidatus Bipolaricaulis sp.]|nr:hypothetical protein [Candidatus Bipolaricaulis sp.]